MRASLRARWRSAPGLSRPRVVQCCGTAHHDDDDDECEYDVELTVCVCVAAVKHIPTEQGHLHLCSSTTLKAANDDDDDCDDHGSWMVVM